MTTFWARMLIFNEYKHGTLPKKAAQHFDEILNHAEYISINANEEIRWQDLNGSNTRCVLGNIGATKVNNTNIYKFDVVKYIKQCVVDTKTEGNTRRDILANLIGQEFSGLDYEIEDGLRNNIYTEEELKLIKQYLQNTYQVTAENDISRSARRIIRKISEILQEEYIKPYHISDDFGLPIE